MNIKAFLFDDDRGVSPVIGVILMVAITVILAAVIAAFVLGLGDTNSTAPSVTFDYDTELNEGSTNSTVQVSVTGGDSFDPSLIELQVDGSDARTFSVAGDESATGDDEEVDSTDWNDVSSVTAGDSITIHLGDDSGSGDEATEFELDIIFTSEDGGTSSRIGGTSGPNA